jgi:hypothetical protein
MRDGVYEVDFRSGELAGKGRASEALIDANIRDNSHLVELSNANRFRIFSMFG